MTWVEDTVLAVPAQYRHKLLLGLNFYGMKFCEGRAEPVKADQVLDLLEKHRPRILWDKESEEHFFEVEGCQVWYPTLKSLDVRLRFAEDENLSGAALWEVGQGLDYFTDLL